MPKADGSVLIITEIDTNGVVKSTKEIKGTLKDIGKESEKSGKEISGGLSNSFKKLGAAIAAAGIVDKIADIGKEAVNLGSDLEEVQNVVDVTFTTMSDKVDEFAKAAAATAGLSETMAKKYVGTFGAMADSFGFAEAEAFEMSVALTQLAGDLASFYNISQDEAFTKLKSVFTGETESLKELGVVMTQTALDAYAMANGFGKVTSEMTEQEKVALRVQFVMDQLSGASGDFVRTQESWANQTRVLQLQWESLLAIIGSGLIEAFTPTLQFITEDVMPALTKLAKVITEAFEDEPSEKLNKSMKRFDSTIKDINREYDESLRAIEENAVAAEHYRKRLEELERAGLETEESQRQYAATVEKLNEIYPELNLQIDEQTGLLDEQSKSRLRNLDAMKKAAVYKAKEKQYTALLEEQAAAIIAVEEANADLVSTEEERKRIEESLTNATGMQADQLIKLYQRQNVVNDAIKAGGDNALLNAAAMQTMTDASGSLTGEQMDLVRQMIKLSEEEERLTSEIEDGNAAISAQDAKLGALSEEMGTATETANETAGAVEELADAYTEAADKAAASVNIQVGLFDQLSNKSDKSAAEIVQNWKDQQAAFSNYSENLRKAIDLGLDETLVKQLSDGSEQSMLILNELINGTEMSIDEMNQIFRDRMQIGELTEIQMVAAQGASAKKLQAMLDEFKKKWPEMSDVVKAEVANIQKHIDSIAGKTFYITAQTTTSNGPGTGGGKPIFPSTPDTASVMSVPMLATGAVIPPGKPFLAMLGDQTNGTNVEAPLATIQEAVASVMMPGFEALLEENRRLRAVVENIEVGDSTIGQAAERYNKKMSIARGG